MKETAVKPSGNFWNQVLKTPECWIWRGYTTKDGYGLITINGVTTTAHRFSWELHHGRQVPYGLCVLHRCDNPTCVRPDHLFLGTHYDNTLDMWEKDRHPLTKHFTKLTEGRLEQIKTRLRRGGNQTRLAERFGVTRQYISLIKLGEIEFNMT